ncbi:hypothetical protein FOMPIDRAFT_82781 [Fomitopsis schrenkii]|uniref:Uncharacterized protein n=1 Tax=Fomitopsis schrenkii TaxID=2126942 RepID=S8EP67_FOMSC|nr:hypothetical protein FOMPIDRAFT_82781 [Fomitopsis schrenkii]
MNAPGPSTNYGTQSGSNKRRYVNIAPRPSPSSEEAVPYVFGANVSATPLQIIAYDPSSAAGAESATKRQRKEENAVDSHFRELKAPTGVFVCKIGNCREQFPVSVAAIRDHLMAIHKLADKNADKYGRQEATVCPWPECRGPKRPNASLSKHICGVHCSRGEYQCILCKCIRDTQGGIKDHIKKYHTQVHGDEEHAGGQAVQRVEPTGPSSSQSVTGVAGPSTATVSPTPPGAFSPGTPLALYYARPTRAAAPPTLPVLAQPTTIDPVCAQKFDDVRFMFAGNPPEPPVRPRNPIAVLVDPAPYETVSEMSDHTSQYEFLKMLVAVDVAIASSSSS